MEPASAHNPPPGPAPKRLRNWVLGSLLALLGLSLAGLLLASHLLGDPSVKRKIQQALSDRASVRIDYQEIGLSYFPTPAITLQQVTIANDMRANTGSDCGSCNIEMQTASFCTFDTPTPGTWSAKVQFAQVPAVVDVFQSDYSIMGLVRNFCVLCAGGSQVVELIEGTPCESGSGGGGSGGGDPQQNPEFSIREVYCSNGNHDTVVFNVDSIPEGAVEMGLQITGPGCVQDYTRVPAATGRTFAVVPAPSQTCPGGLQAPNTYTMTFTVYDAEGNAIGSATDSFTCAVSDLRVLVTSACTPEPTIVTFQSVPEGTTQRHIVIRDSQGNVVQDFVHTHLPGVPTQIALNISEGDLYTITVEALDENNNVLATEGPMNFTCTPEAQ